MDAPSIGETVVRVDGLSKSYGRVRALDDVAFNVCTGEILGLIGPNGAGKTTLFECVAGLEAADQGRVFFGSVPVGGQRRSSKLFYVPDGIAPWGDQPVSWVLDYSLGFFGGRREIYQHVVADLALAADGSTDPRVVQGTAQAHLTGAGAARTAAHPADRRTLRRSRPASEPRSGCHAS